MDAASVDKLCDPGDTPCVFYTKNRSFWCYPVRCLSHEGQWPRRVFVTKHGTHAITRSWNPTNRRWTTKAIALGKHPEKLMYWGFIPGHKQQRFSASDLLYLVRMPSSFCPPRNMQCALRDPTQKPDIDNVVAVVDNPPGTAWSKPTPLAWSHRPRTNDEGSVAPDLGALVNRFLCIRSSLRRTLA